MAQCSHTILVVDDESDVREMIRDSLELDGYVVLTAEGGGRALALVSERRPIDLVITDIKMPGMDGLELIAKLRELAPDLGVIVVSGYLDLQAVEPDGALAHVRVLRKPFGFQDLATAVRSSLEDAPQ